MIGTAANFTDRLWRFGLLALATALLAEAAYAKPVAMPADYPIAMTFRAFDDLKLGSEAYSRRLDEHSPYAWIHAARPYEAAAVIHRRWPNKIVTLQEAYGGVSPNEYDQVWPGHLLYQPGTLLKRALSPDDSEIVVENRDAIARNNKMLTKLNRKHPVAAIVYALDASGKPDWSQAEHVIVESMHGAKFSIKRGQWGSKPLAFKAGRAVMAMHMMFWMRQWQVNFSLHSPKGGAGLLTGAEWYARHIARKLTATDADGVEFDVARWTWGYPEEHPMDANNDRIADYGYIDGVNSFGLGGQVFFRELRKQVGADKIIQADSNDALGGVRGWQYLNGVQMESFPDNNHFERFSPAFTHFRLWTENAEATPKLSYAFTKAPTTVFSKARKPDGGKTDFRFRVGLAAATLTGMPHPFASLKHIKFDPANIRGGKGDDDGEDNQQMGVFVWDEYHGGDLNDWHWLGRPVAAAQQDLSGLAAADLLAHAVWQWRDTPGFTAGHSQTPGGFATQVQAIPAGILPETMWFGVQLTAKPGSVPALQAHRQYTLEFEARGDDVWHYGEQTYTRVPRMVAISGAVEAGKKRVPITALVDATWRKYRISFTANGSSAPAFGVAEQTGATELRNIRLYAGGAERWSREFEKGLVLLNMTDEPWRVPVKKGGYRRLKGAQAPEINTGQVIENDITVPAQDAVFLTKR